MKVVISVAPDAPVGEKWALHISPNSDKFRAFECPDRITLQGFASSFDARVFSICHLDIDPFVSNGVVSDSPFNPPKAKPKQIKLL